MKKKILTTILATALVASMLTACGNKTNDVGTSAAETTETAKTGSDDRDSEATADTSTTDTASDVSTDTSADSETTFTRPTVKEATVIASETAIELFGSEIPELDMQFTPENINAYLEENSNRQVVADSLVSGARSNVQFVYNPANYSSTLDMIKDAQSNYPYDNIFYQDAVDDEQIANAIDALTNELGVHIVAMVCEAQDNYIVMFYCDNGIGYGSNDFTTERIEFGTGGYDSEGYDAENNPHRYNVYADGTVETVF